LVNILFEFQFHDDGCYYFVGHWKEKHGHQGVINSCGNNNANDGPLFMSMLTKKNRQVDSIKLTIIVINLLILSHLTIFNQSDTIGKNYSLPNSHGI
jgi:hypothetical protein